MNKQYLTLYDSMGEFNRRHMIYVSNFLQKIGFELPPFWERVANSACHLFILWLLIYNLSVFPFGVGGLT